MKRKRQIYIVDSPAQTKKTGRMLAKEILANGAGENARVLALSGELGAGKTNFIQGFAKGLGIGETISSPTFVIAKIYPLPPKIGFEKFYHIDCYRLNSAADLTFLNIKEIFADPKNIAAIEWPDIAAEILPPDATTINFEITGKKSRRVSFAF